jgi:hypothetical protein
MSPGPAPGPARGRAPRPRRHLAMRALLDSAGGRDAVLAAAPDLPDEAGQWLAELCQLRNVPFNLLVPDARMLPAESVRFFVIDQNWLDSLVDGALSVAAAATPEAELVALHRPRLQAEARARAGAGVRAEAGDQPGAQAAAPPVWTGLLLRSALVAGAPALAVTGYAGEERSASVLPPVRLDRVAPSVLIAIFAGFVRRVEISLPAEGLHFGVIPSQTQPPAVAVRFIGGGSQFPPGEQPPDNPTVTAGFRDADRGVLDIKGLVGNLETALRTAYRGVPPPPLHSAAFGIQMVTAPERRAFVHGDLVHGDDG